MSDLSAQELASGAGAATPKSAAITPGPWSIYEQATYYGIRGADYSAVARSSASPHGNSGSLGLANALLIAAAPELLDAAQRVMATKKAWDDYAAIGLPARALLAVPDRAAGNKAFADLAAAIAKALGPAPSTSGATDASQGPGLDSRPESPAPTREEGR